MSLSSLLPVLTLFLFISVAYLFFLLFRLKKDFNRLASLDSGNLDDILKKLLEKTEKLQNLQEENQKEIAALSQAQKISLSRCSLIRFNPFPNMGGNQSFIAALLNEEGDGLLFTSLHGHQGTRLYAKLVEAAQVTGVNLSPEEKKAILQAKKGVK